jgi:hypothetical protein
VRFKAAVSDVGEAGKNVLFPKEETTPVHLARSGEWRISYLIHTRSCVDGTAEAHK